MAEEVKKPANKETDLSRMELDKSIPYHKFNTAFALMSIIPLLVFFYLLITRLLSMDIVVGNTGLILLITFFFAVIGYYLGYSIIRDLLKKITDHVQKTRFAYAQLKETQAMLIQAEKFKAVGQLASGIAHEVKNPLGIILQDINYLETNISPEKKEVANVLAMMKRNIERADKIIRILVDFSRVSKVEIKSQGINPILESSLSLIQKRAELKNIKFVKELGNDLPNVLTDTNKMEQVFLNILLNSIQAMPNGGTIFVRTYQRRFDNIGFRVGRRRSNGDYFEPGEIAVVVEVEDTGVGISKEDIEKVFDPFFTKKAPGDGMGLGLSITRNIIEMHKGLIEIQSEEGRGTKVSVILKTSGG